MKELEQFSTDQLKVMVYDASQQLTFLRQQLEILNQEITRRQQPQTLPHPQVAEQTKEVE